MKAVVYTEYGTPDGLELKEVDRPSPGDDDVLVKVAATSLNDWDWQLLQGIPFANRMANGLLKPKKYRILGCDIAGKIEAVGRKVRSFKPGDDVYGDLSGNGFGGFAEYACAPETALAPKPAGMTFEEAAAIPQAGMLAVQGLHDKGLIQSGRKLLINGAGGGVGSFAVQIAKLYGAEVTGVDSTEKLDFMRSIGFDHVIDYTREDFTGRSERYDLVLDNKMSRGLFKCLRAVSPNGNYVITGGETGSLMQAFLLGPLVPVFSKKRIGVVILKANKDLGYINELFDAGKIKPMIDRTYGLSELPEAMRYYGTGKHKGKIVINVSHEATPVLRSSLLLSKQGGLK